MNAHRLGSRTVSAETWCSDAPVASFRSPSEGRSLRGMSRSFGRAALMCGALALVSSVALTARAQVPPEVGPQNDPAKIEAAKRHMAAGLAFYQDPNGHKCEEAVREFAKAYELSGSLNALKNMGVCALELERDGEAIELFERFLKGKGDTVDPADKTQVESDLTALKSAVARVTFTIDRADVKLTTVRTPSKGYPITNRYQLAKPGGQTNQLGLHPGSYTITASAPGEKDLSWTVEIANGATLEHTFSWAAQGGAAPGATPPPPGGETTPPDEGGGEGERPIPPTVWIFGGLTVALAVPMTIFMVSASGAKSDFDEQNGNASAGELDELRSDVTTMNAVSDVFLGLTVASAAATAVFYFTRPTEEAAASAPPPSRVRVGSVVPVASPNGGGAFMTGSF
jgi:hypothetical protein